MKTSKPHGSKYFQKIILIALCMLFWQCAGQLSNSQYQTIHSFETDQQFRQVYAIASKSLSTTNFRMALDIPRCNDQMLVTEPLRLRVRDLINLANPITKKVRGKILHAYLTVEVIFQTTETRPDYQMVRVKSTYQVYVSRLGDKRQWIQWQSNGTVEKTLIDEMQIRLSGENMN